MDRNDVKSLKVTKHSSNDLIKSVSNLKVKDLRGKRFLGMDQNYVNSLLVTKHSSKDLIKSVRNLILKRP